jgi:hypothetical protein
MLPKRVRFESRNRLITFTDDEPVQSENLIEQEQEALVPLLDPSQENPIMDSILAPALTRLMTDPNFSRYNDYFILYHLKGLIATYEPLIQPQALPQPEILVDCGAKCKKVGEAIKAKIAESCLTSCFPSNPSSQLQLGVVAYIGSPVSGEMVIINDQVVNEWITYTRAAIEKKAIATQREMLPIESLAQLVDLKIVPEGRHMIKVNYGSEANCFNSPHHLVTWTSTKSPCTITSCRYYR